MNEQKHCPTEPTHFADACNSVPEAACLTIKTNQMAKWAAQSQGRKAIWTDIPAQPSVSLLRLKPQGRYALVICCACD